MTGEPVLILGGTVKAVERFARRHRGEFGITQIITVTNGRHLREHRGARLIVLEDCYASAPRLYELMAVARMQAMDIVYRRCDEVIS